MPQLRHNTSASGRGRGAKQPYEKWDVHRRQAGGRRGRYGQNEKRVSHLADGLAVASASLDLPIEDLGSITVTRQTALW
jgi:hypothetical protein